MTQKKKPIELPGIRNITVSGRIGTGKTTLAERLAEELGWNVLDGGKLFRKLSDEMGLHIKDTHKRPDSFDIEYEERIKKMLREENNHIVQSHLAGFDAQGIDGVFKILVICRNEEGKDKTSVRIDRLMNRDGLSMAEAKEEVVEREKQNLEKFRRLYAKNDPDWVYWDSKYYDLVVNTFSMNSKEALSFVLTKLNIK
jgi:cytidylate kinase